MLLLFVHSAATDTRGVTRASMQRNNTQQASQHHHQQQQHQNHVLKLYAKQERRQRAQIWLATLLSGVCCAAMAYIINLGIEGIDKLRFKATLHLIQPGGGAPQQLLLSSA